MPPGELRQWQSGSAFNSTSSSYCRSGKAWILPTPNGADGLPTIEGDWWLAGLALGGGNGGEVEHDVFVVEASPEVSGLVSAVSEDGAVLHRGEQLVPFGEVF